MRSLLGVIVVAFLAWSVWKRPAVTPASILAVATASGTASDAATATAAVAMAPPLQALGVTGWQGFLHSLAEGAGGAAGAVALAKLGDAATVERAGELGVDLQRGVVVDQRPRNAVAHRAG